MRTLLVIIIIGIFTIVIMGCNSDYHEEEPITVIEEPDWSKTDPLAFLDLLKNHTGALVMIGGTKEGTKGTHPTGCKPVFA